MIARESERGTRMTQRHVTIDMTRRRRLLLTTDVHGEYRRLDETLQDMGFDPDLDVLVMLGDLIDRGPDSMSALEWIERRGVLRILGNHDTVPRMFLRRLINRRTAVSWGGAWFVDLPEEQLSKMGLRLEDAPTAMTVQTPGGRTIGLVHADCHHDWNEHVRRLVDAWHEHHEHAVEKSLWRRDTIESLDEARNSGMAPDQEEFRITGVDHVFHGHTPHERAFAFGDRSWLDTGACYGGALTVVDADEWLDDLGVHRFGTR